MLPSSILKGINYKRIALTSRCMYLQSTGLYLENQCLFFRQYIGVIWFLKAHDTAVQQYSWHQGRLERRNPGRLFVHFYPEIFSTLKILQYLYTSRSDSDKLNWIIASHTFNDSDTSFVSE